MSIAEELWKGYVQLYGQRRKYGSLPKSVRTSESFSGYITNLKVGNSAILLEVSFWKRDRFRLPDKYVWWPARPKHTAVAFGCLARLNSCPFFFFFFWGGISSISRVANIWLLGNFFVGGIRNRFVWLLPHLVGQPIVTWMFGAQWFLHVGQNEVHQRLDGDHLYTYLAA